MEEEYLSLGVEYLGFLNGQLRDLRGYTTLANELIQNADDAQGATEIVFDVRDDALVVENDGVFSDCGHMEERDCPWMRESDKGYRCDFHRFRLTASGDKRRQANTTGAFGIGFIAVYQITDRPELISHGRHWVIQPEQPSERRVRVLRPTEETVGTRFRFPWARDPEQGIRRELGAEPIHDDDIQGLLSELQDVLPSTVLFLRKISKIMLRHNGLPVIQIERIQEGNDILVDTQNSLHQKTTLNIWHLFRGDFTDQGQRIRSQVGAQIEAKRNTGVEIAILASSSDEDVIPGFFHAYLPTQQRIGLPFHINADFYPSSDRKRILFGSDYQGDWNRTAVVAAAETISRALPELKDKLEYRRFWALLDAIYKLADNVRIEGENTGLANFWQKVKPQLMTQNFVFTSQEQWYKPGQTLLLQDREKEIPGLPLLEAMKLNIVHPDLNPYANLLRTLGVSYLSSKDLADALKRMGLDKAMPLSDAPQWIQSDKARQILADEIRILSGRPGARDDLKTCSVAKSRDDWLCPPEDLRRVDKVALEIFEPLKLQAFFVSDDNPEPILELVSSFDIRDGINILENASSELLRNLWEMSPRDYVRLLAWFAARPAAIAADKSYPKRLRELSIWPSGHTLHVLDNLVVPGDFDKDYLHLTNVVAAEVVEQCGDFLKRELHARALTLEVYATQHLPRAFLSDQDIAPEKRRALVRTLIDELGKIRDSEEACRALSICPIIECVDGQFRKPEEVYFDSELVTSVLGSDIPSARIPDYKPQAARALFEWLGVASVPRPREIITHVRHIVQNPPTGRAQESIQALFVQLGTEWNRAFSGQQEQFEPLKYMAWLPATGDQENWYKPKDIYAVFRDYLFATQAFFLNIARNDQGRCSDFINFLQIPIEPGVEHVVRHLKSMSSRKDISLNLEVYTFLNRNVGHSSITQLFDTECLLIEHGNGHLYIHPTQAFWGAHPFGRYRFRLSDKFRAYAELLKRLGVRDAPNANDAIAVLREISEKVGHNCLDEDSSNVVMQCWKMLNYALDSEEIAPELLADLCDVPSVPNDQALLMPPQWIYFEDRPGLKEKFDGFLVHNVIPRFQGVWRAMQAAGVRFLSQAVTVRLVECENSVLDEELLACRDERVPLIARVLDSQGTGVWNRNTLNMLEIKRAHNLMVTYTVEAFRQTRTTTPENVMAFFDESVETIYFVENDEIPWSALSRELAYALCPHAEVGLIASALKEVLRSPSVERAENELSELGLAFWKSTETLDLPESGEVDPGGTDLLLEEPGIVPDGSTAETDIEEPEPGSLIEVDKKGQGCVKKPDPDTVTDQPEQPQQVAPDSKHDQPDQLDEDESDKGNDLDDIERPTVQKGEKKRGRGGRLRTYVESDGSKDGPKRPVDTTRWLEIDQAGVEYVLAFERSEGRVPTEMPHMNPGYDVESRDTTGEIVRYIEVKSTSGKWDRTGVALSDTQFKMAQEQGQLYWLYVVENAENEEHHLLMVQDPAQRVNQFFYDDGWRDVAVEGDLRGHRRSILDLKRPD